MYNIGAFKGDEVMQREMIDKKGELLNFITKIDDYFNKEGHVPYEEAYNVLLLIRMISKIKEQDSVSKVSDLKIKHNCYHTLQRSYRIISKETTIALNNITDNSLAIIIGQFGILGSLEEYLEREKEIPLNILMEMNARTIKGIKESEKVFKKINNISVK